LLVTIAIIAILLGLLLPAVQSVRESGRILQCKNNLRMVALGCIQHEDSQGFFPASSGYYGTTGDPDRGFGSAQGGGWLYNILPFIERTTLHQLGAGLTDLTQKRAAVIQRVNTAVPAYNCPTRGSGFVHSGTGFARPISVSVPRPYARSDYGGNREGLIRGMVRAQEATDGLSNVILCGERNFDPDRYYTQGSGPTSYDSNQHGWTIGHDHEVLCRGSQHAHVSFHMPIQDTPGVASVALTFIGYGAGIAFGSAHGQLNVAMGDGSVQSIPYTIDPAVLQRLARLADGGSIDDLND
jgi:type II secretory pathway pseudopilin PulG